MKEYHSLKNTLYKNWKRVNLELNRLNYYGGEFEEGTLLHGAVAHNFVGYVELLVKDRSDPNVENKFSSSTPLGMAQRFNYLPIISSFDDVINNDDNKEKKENEEKDTAQEEMDMQSLSLRYDVMYTYVFCFNLIFLFFFSFCLIGSAQKKETKYVTLCTIFTELYKFVCVKYLFFTMFGI